MRRALYLAALVVAFVILAWSVADVACAATAVPRDTTQVLYEILSERDSPLAEEVYTLVAFRRANGPEFSMIDFLTILWAESNLGRDSSVAWHHNVASIIGGKPGTLWRDLRVGTFGSRGYNEYATFRDGQRAALRLVMERYGGSVLRGGLQRWYGVGVPGWNEYQADVSAAKAHLLREGREHGLAEVHLQ